MHFEIQKVVRIGMRSPECDTTRWLIVNQKCCYSFIVNNNDKQSNLASIEKLFAKIILFHICISSK